MFGTSLLYIEIGKQAFFRPYSENRPIFLGSQGEVIHFNVAILFFHFYR